MNAPPDLRPRALLFWALALWLLGPAPPAAAVELPVPLPPGTELLEIEEHPEYLRYHLRTDVDFVVEITPARGGPEPVCSGGDQALWVRRDLSAQGESFVWDLPPVVDALCAHLKETRVAPEAPRRRGGGPTLAWIRDPRFAKLDRLFAAIAAAGLALLAAAVPRERAALAALAAAGAARLALSPRWVMLGGDAAYERLISASGVERTNVLYGRTWPVLMGWLEPILPDLHARDLLISSLAPPLLYGIARRLDLDRGIALAAAGLLCVLPLPLALAGTESHFVLVTTLQLGAALGAMSGGGWAGGALAGLLVHARPLQGLFALLIFGILARRRRWGALALGGAVCAWRAWEVTAIAAHSNPVQYEQMLSLRFLTRSLIPADGSYLTLVDPTITPLVLTALALAGFALRRDRVGALPLVAAGLSIAPYLAKHSPAGDPARFQLPAQSWLALGAAIGLHAIWRRSPRAAVAIGVAAGLSWIPARAPLDGGWAWQHEHRYLRAVAPPAPADASGEAVVRFDATQDPNRHFEAWLNRGDARWIPRGDGPLEAGQLLYRGTADYLSPHPPGDGEEGLTIGGVAGDRWPGTGCALRPLDVVEIPARTDGWVDFEAAALKIGLYEVTECPEGG